MFGLLLKVIIKLAGSEAVKEVVKYGAKQLVNRTDTGIDDDLANSLLGDVQSSNRNKVKKVVIEEAKKVLVDSINEVVYDKKGK